MTNEPWSFKRIQKMIADGVEESLHLDYKGAGSLAKIAQKRDEIVKDATAFANSDGGVIIYGVSEYSDMDRKHLPESIDPIKRSDFSREWLEHVISNAAPRIHGLRIHPIPVPDDETKCLFVVEIPKGETAHQSQDCKYYKRYNFESVPMRDHEVRDVMNRIKVPRIEVEAFLGIRQPWEESSFLLRVRNVGRRIALHYAAAIRLPPVLDGVMATPVGDHFTLGQGMEGSYFEFSLGQGAVRQPLFPKATIVLRQMIRVDVADLKLYGGKPLNPSNKIEVKVYADEMEMLHLEFDPRTIRGKWSPPDAILSHPESISES